MTTTQTAAIDRDLGGPFDLLRSYRRRFVLARVSEAEDPVSIDWLAAELAAAGTDESTDEVTAAAHDRNRIRLHHADIPPLAAAGLVHYDTQRGLVSGGDLPLVGAEWLEMPVAEALDAWSGR